MTPPSPTVEPIDPDELIGVPQPAPEPFAEPVCLQCYYPLAGSLYGVLCNDCGNEWLYRREDSAAGLAEIASRAVHGIVEEPRRRWRIG